jgi:formiminotetrahydrofolate cyclodeaminase
VVGQDVDKISQQSIEELNQLIADHSVFCGGGTAAAISASSAASLAILVLDINLKRRSNAHVRDEMTRTASSIRDMQQRLYRAASEDIRVLNELLETQQESRKSGDSSNYRTALESAAREPLAIAKECLDLLRLIDLHIANASRFTVSDFGAAAALAQGAMRSALMMTEVNIALLRDEQGADVSLVTALEDEAGDTRQNGNTLATRIEDRTRAVIRRSNDGRGV